jgi:hypothetical protein
MFINVRMDNKTVVHSHNGIQYTIRMIQLLLNQSGWILHAQCRVKEDRQKLYYMNPFISSLKPGKAELLCLGTHA